jgi:hypothetical protein
LGHDPIFRYAISDPDKVSPGPVKVTDNQENTPTEPKKLQQQFFVVKNNLFIEYFTV